jgi:DNA replication and repair protein RecF
LHLRELILRNYRNYDHLELSFPTGLIVLAGRNAQGKTNIIESIFLSCTGRSHRTPKDRELIQWNKDEALVRTKADKLVGSSRIDIYLNSREKKKILINGGPVGRLGELMGHLNSVIFSPEDLKLVREGPSERRRFMDMELSQIRPQYFYYLQQYNRILNHRNNLLKDIQKKPSLAKTLPVWDEQLAEAGSFIIQQRHNFNVSLQKIAQEIHNRITNGTEELSLVYKSSVPYKTGTLSEIKESFIRELEIRQADDIDRGLTSRGCHRDDMSFHINGVDVRMYGSQGQKRTTVLSIKLSELEFMYGETGEYPLLLLDDAMSELDSFRQKMLLEYIDKVQTFVTVTDLDQFPDIRSRDSQIFRIRSGTAVPQGSSPF